VRLEALVYFYRRRLRTHPTQELLAGIGIAVGVALAFAVLVANGSISSSADKIVRGVTGNANLQLTARDARGFDEGLLQAVRQLPGVRRAAPLLDQRVVIRAPNGRAIGVDAVSLDPSLAAMSGRLAGNFVAGGLRYVRGVLLPSAAADALGLPNPAKESVSRPLPSVSLQLRGRVYRMRVAAVLGSDTIGPMAKGRSAILPLRRLQRLAGLRGRATRILIQTRPGQAASARNALAALARQQHLDLGPAHAETQLLKQALGPSDQATGFFAAISAVLGLLLAFNAMLLTAPERRRMIAELRIQGFRPRQLVVLVLFQALVLGTVASIAGLCVGDLLSRRAFNQSPEYLAPAFTLGSGTIVGIGPIVIALAGGIVASCLASVPPLLDLRRGRVVDAVLQGSGTPGNALGPRTQRRLLAVAITLLAVSTGLLLLVPSVTLAACALLALATVCLIPTTFAGVVRLGERLSMRVQRLSLLTVALLALRATTLRSLALAATGAVAVFGSVAIGGARSDLLRGISNYTSDFVGTADVWVVNGADNQATNDFRLDGAPRTVAAVPGVAAVRVMRGGFLDFLGRRVWLIARPGDDPTLLPASQLLHGDLAEANGRLRAGGWISISDQIARTLRVDVGDTVSLPTPSGDVRYRVAATTTNLGWSPGAIILNGADYQRAWRTSTATALEVDLTPNASPAATRTAIVRALGPDRGLHVQLAAQRARGINASASQGLSRLGQIASLLLVAAVLAMAAAMGAAIWQRRSSLAALRIQSFTPRQLWRVLLLESGVVLGAGCLTGAATGIYGQLGIDRYLTVVTSFPIAPAPGGWRTLETFAFVVAAALAVVAIPGWFASRVPPHIGLQE
jgi:putative ABC transport system permease protein